MHTGSGPNVMNKPLQYIMVPDLICDFSKTRPMNFSFSSVSAENLEEDITVNNECLTHSS